jgi:hypothetical protein
MTEVYVGIAVLLLAMGLVLERRRRRRQEDAALRDYYRGRTRLP